MKLKKCYIANFGTLHDFSYEFQDGLNIICEDNGWGKTTFGVFIKAMFYGLEYNARRRLADNERKKYMPWQGGSYGGYIEFDVGEKEYKLERYFGKRDKDDTFSLYDKKTGLLSQDYSNKIGEELFQLDVAAYERSTYIPQNAVTISMNDSINAKLSNLVENGNDINNYENAYARLEEHLKEYKKTGGRGKIPLLKEQVYAKQEEIEECRHKAEGMVLIEAQIEEQKIRRRELERQREEIKAAILQAGNQKEHLAKTEHFATLRRREAEIIEKKRIYDEIFANVIPDEQLFSMMSEELEEINQLQVKCEQTKLNEDETKLLDELEEFFVAGCPDSPEIEMYLGESREYDGMREEIIRMQARVEALEGQKQQEKNRRKEEAQRLEEERKQRQEAVKNRAEFWQKLFLTMGILFLAVGIVCFLLTKALGVAGIAVGILFLILATTRKSNANKQLEKLLIQEEHPENTTDMESIYQQELEELSKKIEEGWRLQKAASEHYQAFISQFPFQDMAESQVQLLTKLEGKATEYRRLSYREQELREQKGLLQGEKEQKEKAFRQQLCDIHKKYGEISDLWDAYENLREDCQLYEHLMQEFQRSQEELREFADSNPEVWQKMTETQSEVSIETGSQEIGEQLSPEELQQQEKQCESELAEIDEKIHSYRKDLDNLSVIVDRQTEYESDLDSLKAQLQEAEYKAGVLEKTMQYLKEAKESFSTHYMGKMRHGFEKYASMICEEEKSRIHLNVQLEAQLDAQGALREAEYFSTGNRDLVGICIRLALVEALFTEEKPFIILDDPFVNLDDGKTMNAKKLLKQIAQEYQIIYLVCHSSRI